MQHTYKELCPLNMTRSGEIYLARQEDTGLLVVRKSLALKAYDFDVYDLYKRLLQIHHPNLMQIIEVELQEDACIVIEEYISGETLAAILKRNINFREEDVKPYLFMLCSAVQTLHKNGIIHRDITPNNIMLTNDGLLKLCDYDISRVHKEGKSVDTQLFGTRIYAAPEQYGYGQTDQRSDIYAIGMVANVMLTGREGMMYYRSNKLGRVIRRAVKIEREERYASIEKMEAALQRKIIDKDRPLWKFISFFFGIQNFSPWKMFAVPVVYSYIIYEFCLCDSELSADSLKRTILFGLPLILIMDICHVSRYVLRLENGQRWFRIVIGLGLLFLFSVIFDV